MPKNLRSLKWAIAEIFDKHESRCLWFSGGSDSRLLLEIMLETGKTFGILQFTEGWSREQHRQADEAILMHDLQVFSHPAIANSLVAEGENIGLVSQYAINGGGESVMLIRDLVDDAKRCAYDVDLTPARSRPAIIEYDAHIMGLRHDDRHWIAGKPLIDGPERTYGGKTFKFPLAGWSAKQVRRTLKTHYGIDLSGQADLGDINACHNCLKGEGRVYCPKSGTEIDAVVWDRQASLNLVRELL
jgi:hypothetical protein